MEGLIIGLFCLACLFAWIAVIAWIMTAIMYIQYWGYRDMANETPQARAFDQKRIRHFKSMTWYCFWAAVVFTALTVLPLFALLFV